MPVLPIYGEMSQVSRPMQIVLLVTLLFAALWFVALRPKSSGAGGGAAAPAQTAPAAPGVAGLKNAIAQAHGAVTTADGDAQRAAQSNADGSTTPAAPPAAGTQAPGARPAAPGHRTEAGAHHARRHAAAAGRVHSVRAALHRHLAVAVAFVDPDTADSQAVERELLHVSRFGGRAYTLSVPLADLSDYAFITDTVQVTVAPTVVIVDPHGKATTIVGFADRDEIEQRLADALAAGRHRR